MAIDVTDIRSNPKDQIAHAAEVIGKSEHRRRVFAAIYKGKKKVKTASEIETITRLDRIRVLQEAGKLSDNGIAKKTKANGEIAYEKDPFYTQNKKKILALAGNREALKAFPTKTNPRSAAAAEIIIRLPRDSAKVRQVTVDDIDSFAKLRKLSRRGSSQPVDEKQFKYGIQRILGEAGEFKDWGGEMNDLFTTRLVIDGFRKTAAFGFKGKATTGKLVPRKLGKAGDQIQRLFRAPADVFIVQYWGQIDESVLEQLKAFATAKSVSEEKEIIYGVVDGQDTLRILRAYPEAFKG